MGKCIAYVAAAVVFMGVGALVAGICVWYLAPSMTPKKIQLSRNAECLLTSSFNVSGTVYLEQFGPGRKDLTINANITGLTSGLHGFHIHTWGVPADGDCTACGGHYNPKGVKHGGPNDSERHVGDLGNINATEDGTFVEMKDHVASLWGDESVVGRAIVIHAGQDDLGDGGDEGSKKTGNAGGRVACCTIFLVKE